MNAVQRSSVTIIGAGFAGLAAAHRLAEAGVDDVVILERSDGVGGTWKANTYPGAACDVPSHLYSLSFAPNPDWSKAYANQDEILAYVEACYDRFGLRPKVRLSTQVVAIEWQQGDSTWLITDAAGNQYQAALVVSAVGLFHTPLIPEIPGLADFAGPCLHSARWDHGVDLDGIRVAVIGTGASAIQVVPAIAERVAHLTVYQRTPAWIMPRNDDPYSEEQRALFASEPAAALRHRNEIHSFYENNTYYFVGDPAAAVMEQRALDHLRQQVGDPSLRDRLTPRYPIGAKRILVSSDFYPALQRDDVELVTDRIDRITSGGIVSGGQERSFDVLILCTGFRTVDYLHGIRVTGRDGTDLHRAWAGVPRAYHGMAVPGFPNLFLMYGPNTNQGGNSILLMLEAQAAFLASAVSTMRERGALSAEVTEAAMRRYVTELEEALSRTVWVAGDSYFRTASGEVVTQTPLTTTQYGEVTRRLNTEDFHFTGVTHPASA